VTTCSDRFTPVSDITYRDAGRTHIGNLLEAEFDKYGEESDDQTRNIKFSTSASISSPEGASKPLKKHHDTS
jgi:hypothetical protein